MFITIEGLDASGKGTQVRKLKEYLETLGHDVWVTAEPTNNAIGKLIKNIQKSNIIKNPSEKTMLCLYAADRAEHQKEIKEHLDMRDWIICDRYTASSEAYQDFNEEYVKACALNKEFIKPDLTFIIDISAEEAVNRIQKRGKTAEIFEKKDILEKVRNKYREIYDNEEHSRVIWIDGEQSVDRVFEQIKKTIDLYA